MAEIKNISVESIVVGGYDQRLELDEDEVTKLASSIARVGLLYPILVKKNGDKFIIIDGHTRFAAVKKLGWKEVLCITGEMSVSETVEIAFAGNFFRKDLSPVELAAAMKDVREDGDIGLKELAAGFHKSEHWVVRMIAIADWPGDVQEAIHEGAISVSAGANLAIVTDEAYRSFLVRNAIEGGATARTTAAWLQAWRAMQPQEEAIKAVPVAGQVAATISVPSAPCLCCSQLFEVNQMSHVPICGGCIQIIRTIGQGAA